MPPEQNAHHGRRPQFHRGRRGPERRGGERRTLPHTSEAQARSSDHVDVEQIMRDIRSRISQRHGIDLSAQQIQELAARRLEAILEPRHLKPALLEQLRRGAAQGPEPVDAPVPPPYTFEDTTLYDSHRGAMRFMRRLLNPVLKLFFNPNPLIQALNIQARVNTEVVKREAEREVQQAEWNALHYEILQRVVTEMTRMSMEMQALSGRMESLAAKVDFNERRVRGLEKSAHHGGGSSLPPPPPRQSDPPPVRPLDSVAQGTAPSELPAAGDAPGSDAAGDPARRRRRRRRGRRSGPVSGDSAVQGVDASPENNDSDALDPTDQNGGDEESMQPAPFRSESATTAPHVGTSEVPHAQREPREQATDAIVQPTPPRDEPNPPSAMAVTPVDPNPVDR